MTFFPGGVPGAPRDAEVMRQYGKAKQEELQAEAEARHEAHDAHDARRPGWLRRRLGRRRTK